MDKIITGRYDKPKNNQAFYYQHLTDCIIKIPECSSEIEQALLKRLNFSQFMFQFPPYLDATIITKQCFNLNTQFIEEIKVLKPRVGRPGLFPRKMPKNQQHEVKIRWHEYLRFMELTEQDFREAGYMKLYAILRDYFITNLLNMRNHKKLEKVHENYLKIITHASSLLYRIYSALMNQFEDLESYLTEGALKQTMAEIESFLKPLFMTASDGTRKNRMLLIPDLPKTKNMLPQDHFEQFTLEGEILRSSE